MIYVVLNTLRTACQLQPPATGLLPISPDQVFSLTPSTSPSPTINETSPPPPAPSEEGGFSWNAKVAIAISVPVAALLIFSLVCLLYYVHRNSRRRRSKKRLTKSSSHRTHRSHRPTNKFPPNHKPHHRKTLSNETARTSEKEKPQQQWTFNRPLTYPAPSVHSTSKDHNNYNRVPYPAPLRTRTTPSPNLTSPQHTESAAHQSQSPRSRLPSHLTSLSRPQTANSLSPPPLNIPQHHHSTHQSPLSPPPLKTPPLRPPPPPRGLVSWEQRGIQHARTKSMRDSMRRSGESFLGGEGGRWATTERVKVAMQVPRDANISEWKEETRTPTPVTEEGVGDEGKGERERDWKRRTGSP
ncbi:MAG: hypothetical protein Q9209_006158 [Squamulea sp. 1 TL-2023]